MPIDVDAEDLITFTEATRSIPGRKKIAIQTLHRWRLHGVRGVRLETVLLGGIRYTSKQAIRRFFESQNANCEPVAVVVVTPTQRTRQNAAAREALRAAGI